LTLALTAAPVARPDAAQAACAPNAIYVPSCGAWQGTWPGVQTLSQWEATVGRKADIYREFKLFDSYNDPSESFPGPAADAAIAGGRMYYFSWRPEETVGATVYRSWADIAAGKYDATFVNPTADKIKAWGQSHGGKKIFFTFHHEPENSRGTPAEYVAAWRHIYNVFTARGARPYLIFTWVMSGFQTRPNQWGALYPGDAYVDWLGYDPYARVCVHHVTTPPPKFTTTFGESAGTDVDDTGKYRFYKWATGAGAVDSEDHQTYRKPGSFTKPIMAAEYGAYYGTDYPTAMEKFFKDMKASLSAGGYPQIKAFIYYQARSCSRVDSTAGTKAAFQDLLQISRLKQPKPY
jgi:beta-mannanase